MLLFSPPPSLSSFIPFGSFVGELRAQIGGYDNVGIDVYIAPSVVERKKGNERSVETYSLLRQKVS